MILLVRRFLLGAEVEGVFTLFALQFFLTGIMLFGIGLMGEYVGRIQQEVRRRPRYRITRCSRTRRRGATGEASHEGGRLRLLERRRPLPARAARARRRRAAGRHARDAPGETIWFRRVAETADELGLSTLVTPTIGRRPALAVRRRCGAARRHLFLLLPLDAADAPSCALAPRGALQHARLALAALSRPGADQLGGAARRAARPARPCTRWSRKPDAGRIVDQQAVPILPDDTAREVFDKVTVAAEQVLWRALPAIVAGTAQVPSQRSGAGQLLRARAAPRTAGSTGRDPRARSTT